MMPQSKPREFKNSSKVNLVISLTFHTVLVLVLFYFAAREGLLGKKLQKISVTMEKKEKPPEKPKPPEPPKVQPPKVETPKTEAPKVADEKPAAPPAAAQMVAPPAVEVPAMDFEGGKAVETSSDPVQLYKARMEYTLKSAWSRPENMDDAEYVADVEVGVAKDGTLSNPVWQKGSGNDAWDKTVRAALAAVTKIDRSPPTNFPPRVVIRFDVQQETEPVAP